MRATLRGIEWIKANGKEEDRGAGRQEDERSEVLRRQPRRAGIGRPDAAAPRHALHQASGSRPSPSRARSRRSSSRTSTAGSANTSTIPSSTRPRHAAQEEVRQPHAGRGRAWVAPRPAQEPRRPCARIASRRHHAAGCPPVPVGDPHDDRAHAADRRAIWTRHRLPAHRPRRHHPVRCLRALSQGEPLGAHAADAPAHHQHAAQLVHALQEPRQLRRRARRYRRARGSSGWSPTASARSASSTD